MMAIFSTGCVSRKSKVCVTINTKVLGFKDLKKGEEGDQKMSSTLSRKVDEAMKGRRSLSLR